MKTPQLNPYLAFNGNCQEAMHFYQQCLGGELNIQLIAGIPPPTTGSKKPAKACSTLASPIAASC